MNIAKRYELVPLARIVPYARNARTHSKEQVAQIRASFREFGVLSPCLVDEQYNLLVGHGRLKAAQEENLNEINCVIVEGLTDAQKRAYILADNRLALNAGWDLHGGPTYAYDAAHNVMRCGQAVVKEVPGDYHPDIKLGEQ